MAGMLFLLALVAACSAYPIDSPLAFFQSNSDVFSIALSIIDKAGLNKTLSDPKLNGTYFMPTDFGFLGELSPYLPGNETTIGDVLAAVEAGPKSGAKLYAAAVSTNTTIGTVTELVQATSIHTLGNSTLSAGLASDGTGVAIYEISDGNYYSAYATGPVVILAGQAAIFVTTASLTDATVLLNNMQ